MKKFLQCQTHNWVNGGTVPFQLSVLANKHLIRAFVLHIELSGTLAANEVIAADDFPRSVQNIRLADFGGLINAGGYDIDQLYRVHYGRRPEQRVAVGAGGTTFAIAFDLLVPFADWQAVNPDDTSIPTELIHDRSLELTWAAAGIFGGTIVITAGTCQCIAICVETGSVNVPEFRELSYRDPGGQTIPLESGAWVDAFLTSTTLGGTITVANVTNVITQFDGALTCDNLTHAMLVSTWNIEKAIDVQTGGYTIADRSLPLIWQQTANNLISKAPCCTLPGAKIQLAGTLTTPHLVYWKSRFKDEETVANVGRKQGLVAPKQEYFEARTAGGSLESAPDSPKARKVTSLVKGKFVHPNALARRAAKPAFERK